ncbi:MAG: flavodoxin family protein [Promethearchaeota archaeon]
MKEKKIIAIIGTNRKNGRVSQVAQKIIDGARENNFKGELINLYDYKINHCVGCWSCAKTGKCFQDDDFEMIFEKFKEADYVIIGTPVYWGNVSGIMKVFFDRHTGYAMRIPPDMDKAYQLSFWSKIKLGMSELKKFGPKEGLENKKYIFIITATIPFKRIMGDVPNTMRALKTYVKKLKGKIFAKILYTDTLMQFKRSKREKIMEKAYKIGKSLKNNIYKQESV